MGPLDFPSGSPLARTCKWGRTVNKGSLFSIPSAIGFCDCLPKPLPLLLIQPLLPDPWPSAHHAPPHLGYQRNPFRGAQVVTRESRRRRRALAGFASRAVRMKADQNGWLAPQLTRGPPLTADSNQAVLGLRCHLVASPGTCLGGGGGDHTCSIISLFFPVFCFCFKL